MSAVYRTYAEAYNNACGRARATGLDVAIRAGKEYGRKVFRVSFASRNDSDYSRAEIVTPQHAKGKE